ncbi:trehalose-phosphatase [Paenirhodobacter populi]|uniref:trehalose-phosphatase n=1 Tax=Paenirhodobacter populi TaxID=2306993 RepID=UPI0013E2E41C|nr:trehalose-phosphatase [Sinirhodobacter populi]
MPASDLLLPSAGDWAFFIDLDGTLLDLAASPDAVSPGEGTQDMLQTLEAAASGALALITGRPVAFVDSLFPGYRFTVAGLHGTELRPGERIAPPDAAETFAGEAPTAAFRHGRDLVRNAAQDLPGVLFEDKGRAFALHYRQAPEHRAEVEQIMERALICAGDGYLLRPGKCVVELCPAGADKGTAIRRLMAEPPFAGRIPFAAGDDVTDEAMFRVVNEMNGLSLRIGEPEMTRDSLAMAKLPSPADFRTWMRRIA